MNGTWELPVSSSSTDTTWVQRHFTAQTVGGVTVYDLTCPAS